LFFYIEPDRQIRTVMIFNRVIGSGADIQPEWFSGNIFFYQLRPDFPAKLVIGIFPLYFGQVFCEVRQGVILVVMTG
jgi:hypothetical protein